MPQILTDRVRRLKPIADRVARDIYHRPISEVQSQSAVIRDACDFASGGELDTFQLDLLCNMVANRLQNPRHYGIE